MTPDENLAQWIAIQEKARLGAQAAAQGMADYIARRTAENTLRRNRHPPGQYYKARPGDPPSFSTGKLADSMYSTPASGGLRSTAFAGSNDVRAKLFEYGGCVLKPTTKKVMHWVDSRGSWYHSHLPANEDYPAHPFLSLTTDEAMSDGGLQQAAIDAFIPYDP